MEGDGNSHSRCAFEDRKSISFTDYKNFNSRGATYFSMNNYSHVEDDEEGRGGEDEGCYGTYYYTSLRVALIKEERTEEMGNGKFNEYYCISPLKVN